MPSSTVSFPVSELASRVGGQLLGNGTRSITGLQTVQDAGENDLTFIGDELHAKLWAASKAGAAIVSENLATLASEGRAPGDGCALILVANADRAMIAVLELFSPPVELPPLGIDVTARIDPTASVGKDVRIGPNVIVGRDAKIGDGVSLFAGVVIYPDASIGHGSTLHANVVIRERCIIGRQVILHGGVQIGTDGFGYRPAPDGRGILKVPHLGNVILGDDVEIGANSCVDRGKFGATTIGAGSKLDNLVQIGHNCRLGRCVVISGMTGVAGSTTIGDGTMIGGGVGIADHLTIGCKVQIAARSAVMNDIPDGETWAGYPAKERRRAMQEVIVAAKMPEYIRNLRKVITETLGPEAAKLLDGTPPARSQSPRGS